MVKIAGRDTGSIWLHNAGMVFLPWVVLGALLAWTLLKSVPVQANFKQQMDIFGEKHTWIMTVLYLMTFGAFSGLAAQFGLLTKNLFGQFPDAPIRWPTSSSDRWSAPWPASRGARCAIGSVARSGPSSPAWE